MGNGLAWVAFGLECHDCARAVVWRPEGEQFRAVAPVGLNEKRIEDRRAGDIGIGGEIRWLMHHRFALLSCHDCRWIRSVDRRVGKECVSPCSSRGWPYH